MTTSVRVLLVQKSAAEAEEIVRALHQNSFAPSYRLVHTQEEFRRELPSEVWDLVLSDYAFDSFTALELLEILDATALPYPLIIVAHPIGEERVAAAMQAGAADFIARGNWGRLPAAINRALERAAHRRERKIATDSRLKAHAAMEHEIQKRNQELHKLNRILRDEIVIRRQAEEAQLAVSQRLAMTLRASKAGSWDWDAKHDAVQWSDEMKVLYGLEPSQPAPQYKEWVEYVVPEDREIISSTIRQALKTGVFDTEFRIRRRDTGETRWIHTRGQVFFDDLMKPTRMVGINMDITERKQTEAALESTQRELQAITQTMAAGVTRCSRNLRYLWVSPAYAHWLGLSPDEIAGRPIADVIGEEGLAGIRPFIDRVLTGQRVDYEAEVHFKGPGTRWIHAVYTPTFDATREADGWVAVVTDITERKQLEERLVATTQRLEAHLANSPLANIEFDGAYRVVRWSAEAERMFGWRADEVVGKRIGDLRWVHEDDIARVAELSRAMIEGREPRNVHPNRNYRKDGAVIHCEWYNSAIRDDVGRLVSVFSQVLDVTERLRAAEALRESEERYRTLFETMFEGFAIDEMLFDEAGKPVDIRYLSVNPAFELQTGLKAADILGHTTRQLWPDAEQVWFERYGQVVTTGEPVYFEERFGPLNKWFQVTAYRLGPSQFATIFFDITDHKLAEEALKESEERFRTMANGLPLIVWVHNAQGQQEFVNKTFCEFFGVTLEEMQGGRWQMLLHPDDAEAYTSEFLACTRERRPFHAETRVRNASGEWRWIESWARPRFSDSGEYLGFVGTSADITERREAEDALVGHLRNMGVVSDSATRLLEPTTPERLFEYVAEQVHEMAEGAVVIVSEYDADRNQTIVRAVAGPDHKIRRAVELLGRELGGLALPVAGGTTQRMVAGNLVQVEGGLFDLSFGQLPAPLCRQIEDELNLGSIHAMPFVLNEDFMGTVAILTDRAEGLRNRGVIEACVNQAGLALKRSRVEEALRKSEERFRALADGTPIIIWTGDTTGRNQFVNRAWREFFGASEADARELDWRTLVHPEDLDNYSQVIWSAMQEQRRFVVQARVRRHDGEWRWIESFGEPRISDNGELLGIIGSSLDITERKQAEVALRESEERYRALVQHAPAGIYTVDFRTQRFTSVNDVMCQLLGYTREELLAMDPFDILDEAGKEVFRGRIKQWLAGEAPDEQVEYRVITKDGRELYAVLNVTFTVGKDGRPVGATVIGHDVTERKRLETQLHEAVGRYLSIINAASDGIWIQDTEGRIVGVNDAYCRLSGYAREELLGMPIHGLEATETPEEVKAHIHRVLASDGHDRFRSRHRRKDGSEWPVDITALYLDREGGQIVAFVRELNERAVPEQALSIDGQGQAQPTSRE